MSLHLTGAHSALGSLPPETVPPLSSWDIVSFLLVLRFLSLFLLCCPPTHKTLRMGICPQGSQPSLLRVTSSGRYCLSLYHHLPATRCLLLAPSQLLPPAQPAPLSYQSRRSSGGLQGIGTKLCFSLNLTHLCLPTRASTPNLGTLLSLCPLHPPSITSCDVYLLPDSWVHLLFPSLQVSLTVVQTSNFSPGRITLPL